MGCSLPPVPSSAKLGILSRRNEVVARNRARGLCVRTFIALSVAFIFATTVFPAEQTWSGEISDSACGVMHPEDADAAGGGQAGPPDPHECTLACIRGGSKYVFVSNGMVYQILDQKDPALQTHAGHMVKLTGEMKDTTIKVSKIEMP
jgi:hypothetical protein